jgi:cell division septal protein FtsQ
MAASRLTRPGWLVLLGLALVTAGSFAVPRLLRPLAFFRVRRVEVRGTVNLAPDSIVRVLGLGAQASIFDPVPPLERRVAGLAGVNGVEIGRRLPATLVVKVEEAPAIALVSGSSLLKLVGEDGRVLPFDPRVAAPDLPVVPEADSVVARLLARLREADATFFAQVAEAERSGPDVLLSTGTQRYWFAPDASVEAFRAARAVAQDLARQGRAWAGLDARFSGMVIVRWRTG